MTDDEQTCEVSAISAFASASAGDGAWLVQGLASDGAELSNMLFIWPRKWLVRVYSHSIYLYFYHSDPLLFRVLYIAKVGPILHYPVHCYENKTREPGWFTELLAELINVANAIK